MEQELGAVLAEIKSGIASEPATAGSGANIHNNAHVTVLHVQNLHLDRETLALLLRPTD